MTPQRFRIPCPRAFEDLLLGSASERNSRTEQGPRAVSWVLSWVPPRTALRWDSPAWMTMTKTKSLRRAGRRRARPRLLPAIRWRALTPIRGCCQVQLEFSPVEPFCVDLVVGQRARLRVTDYGIGPGLGAADVEIGVLQIGKDRCQRHVSVHVGG